MKKFNFSFAVIAFLMLFSVNIFGQISTPVSYTHLTLPTTSRV